MAWLGAAWSWACATPETRKDSATPSAIRAAENILAEPVIVDEPRCLLLCDHELDAAVLLATGRGLVRLDGLIRSVATRLHPLRFDPQPHEVLADRVRARLRELEVVWPRPPRIRVAFDAHRHRRAAAQDVGDLVEQREAARLDRGLVGVEEDLLLELDLLLRDDDVLVLLRATGVVGRARLVRALVLLVGDAILVVVGIGAAVLILEAVLVLGLERTLVLCRS